jgi:predicted small lipoprotein YifL
LRATRPSRALCALLVTGLAAASLAGCGRRGVLEPPPGSTSAALPKTVSAEPSPAVAPPPSAGLAGEPLGPAYQTSVPDQVVVPGTGRKSFPLDPLL